MRNPGKTCGDTQHAKKVGIYASGNDLARKFGQPRQRRGVAAVRLTRRAQGFAEDRLGRAAIPRCR